MVMKPVGQNQNVDQPGNPRVLTSKAAEAGALEKTQGAAQGREPQIPETYDVKLSDAGKKKAEVFRKTFEMAKAAPDVREDLVAKYKAMIASGEYSPDAGNIADGILREAAREELAKQG